MDSQYKVDNNAETVSSYLIFAATISQLEKSWQRLCLISLFENVLRTMQNRDRNNARDRVILDNICSFIHSALWLPQPRLALHMAWGLDTHIDTTGSTDNEVSSLQGIRIYLLWLLDILMMMDWIPAETRSFWRCFPYCMHRSCRNENF